MKKCSRCHNTKPLEAFNRRGDKHQSACRECQSKWYREHSTQHQKSVHANNKRYVKRNQKFVMDYLLTHPCVDCQEPDPVVLEFDHVRGKKKYNIATMIRLAMSIAAIEREIAKCEVRCANCHRRATARRHGWYRHQVFPL